LLDQRIGFDQSNLVHNSLNAQILINERNIV